MGRSSQPASEGKAVAAFVSAASHNALAHALSTDFVLPFNEGLGPHQHHTSPSPPQAPAFARISPPPDAVLNPVDEPMQPEPVVVAADAPAVLSVIAALAAEVTEASPVLAGVTQPVGTPHGTSTPSPAAPTPAASASARNPTPSSAPAPAPPAEQAALAEDAVEPLPQQAPGGLPFSGLLVPTDNSDLDVELDEDFTNDIAAALQ